MFPQARQMHPRALRPWRTHLPDTPHEAPPHPLCTRPRRSPKQSSVDGPFQYATPCRNTPRAGPADPAPPPGHRAGHTSEKPSQNRHRPSGVGLLVRLSDIARNTAAVIDVVALLLGPRANLRGVLRAAHRAHRGTGPATARGASPAALLAPLLGVRSEQLAQLPRVRVREVDLVGAPVESERHGLIRLAAVEIVDKKDLNL